MIDHITFFHICHISSLIVLHCRVSISSCNPFSQGYILLHNSVMHSLSPALSRVKPLDIHSLVFGRAVHARSFLLYLQFCQTCPLLRGVRPSSVGNPEQCAHVHSSIVIQLHQALCTIPSIVTCVLYKGISLVDAQVDMVQLASLYFIFPINVKSLYPNSFVIHCAHISRSIMTRRPITCNHYI